MKRRDFLYLAGGLAAQAASAAPKADFTIRIAPLSVEVARGKTIRTIAYRIAEHPMEILPDVPETLQDLSQRHRLFMVTKGNITEQMGKVERSGLREYFNAIEVVAEKDAAAYRAVVEKYGLIRDLTWMIGNSPKSDINPALEAGLHAVFVPHHNTWMLERDELRKHVTDGRLLEMESFGRLRDCF